MGPGELAAVFTGIGAQRTWWYELALFTAWHVAAFNSQAKVGKLKPWSHYSQKVSGRSAESAAPMSWQQRKAARQLEMDLFRKHQQQRKTPPRERHG